MLPLTIISPSSVPSVCLLPAPSSHSLIPNKCIPYYCVLSPNSANFRGTLGNRRFRNGPKALGAAAPVLQGRFAAGLSALKEKKKKFRRTVTFLSKCGKCHFLCALMSGCLSAHPCMSLPGSQQRKRCGVFVLMGSRGEGGSQLGGENRGAQLDDFCPSITTVNGGILDRKGCQQFYS